MDNKIIDRLNKIKQLADRGEENEAAAAMLLLEKSLQKYGYTLQDLENQSSEKTRKTHKYASEYEELILKQIGFFLDLEVQKYVDGRKGSVVIITGTKLQHMEYALVKDTHFEQFKRDLDNFTLAYVHKNGLVGKSKDDESDEEKPKTDPQKLREIMKFMGVASRRTHYKRIE